jgi:hypothetical protein
MYWGSSGSYFFECGSGPNGRSVKLEILNWCARTELGTSEVHHRRESADVRLSDQGMFIAAKRGKRV